MSDAITCPDEAQWDRLLAAVALDDEQATLAEHLETCGVCRQRIERLAAGGYSWEMIARRIAAGQLCSSSLPPSLAAVIQRLKEQPIPDVDPRQAEVSPDLPPGFLKPSRQAGQLGCLEDYEVFEEVGRGAMGVVLRAFDPKLHRVVAIKVMSPHLASFPLARQRFVREGHSAAAVCHENVVAIYAVGEAAGLPYLVMQYVAGKTLQQRLDQSGPLTVAEILRIGMQDAVHKELRPIQGTWKVIALEFNGKHAPEEIVSATRFVFAEQMLTVTPGEPGFTSFRVQLDPTATPPRFDMTHADGTKAGETQQGIYLLAGGQLKICLGTGDHRPTEFTAKAQSRQVMYILERERPLDSSPYDK